MKSNKLLFKNIIINPSHWPTLIALALAWVLAQLPVGALDLLGGAIGAGFYRFARKRRKIIEINLQLCFPDWQTEKLEALVRENFRHTGLALTDALVSLFRVRPLPTKRISARGLAHLERALVSGHGAIVLGAHYLPLFIAGRALCERLGRPLHQLVRRNGNACLEWAIDWGRRRHCGATIGKKQTGDLLRSLRSGNAVCIAPDQDFNYGMAFVPFFGQPAATVTITSKLAGLSGAQVLPMHFYRDEKGVLNLEVGEPLSNFPSADPVADTARWMALVEAAVRAHPEQYLWAHRRFKTRPEGFASVY